MTPGVPGGGGRSPGSRAVTEGGTKQLGGVEIKDGLSTGLWDQMGLSSNASSATSWWCDFESVLHLSEPLLPHP